MKRTPFLLPLFAFLLTGCDQEAIKKEAYDKGFADGQAAVKSEIAKAAAKRQTSGLRGTALDRPGTVAPGAQGRTGAAARLPGTALDQRPSKK